MRPRASDAVRQVASARRRAPGVMVGKGIGLLVGCRRVGTPLTGESKENGRLAQWALGGTRSVPRSGAGPRTGGGRALPNGSERLVSVEPSDATTSGRIRPAG
ncbi:hypothetical protein FFA01_14070 [Frigoribacterium faeni]|uniref:Uncharacterized protein n=1 Tax=Frigoribacterium faeni TaxID=145483 RepID=A0ABQ0UNN0_9MICO|nr:hypothetical protein GCM10025699_59210 [Microbacterium flavescens]GEK83098.1 hypothetical protein FFA01_14070 [Frigoribacterium faeni]